MAASYYAKQRSIPFTVYESAAQVGGNCITYEINGFRIDSGAHRLHVKEEELSAIYQHMLGNDLLSVNSPSAIFYENKFIDFPLSPMDLLSKLGLVKVTRAAISLLKAKLGKQQRGTNFESIAVQTYGQFLADLFLLHYTEKLWGRPANQLSQEVSGARLKGLNLSTFVKEAVVGKRAKTEHLDGSFLYPRYGIGQLMQKLEELSGIDDFKKNASISKVFHDKKRITSVEINGKERVATDILISTLPLNIFPQLMEPKPSEEILAACKSISFRNIALVTFLLNRPSVTPYATIYFATEDWLFTRIVEPRNRSAAMAPDGKTSLMVEVPIDTLNDEDIPSLKEKIKAQLLQTGLVNEPEIIAVDLKFIPNAYPILEIGLDEKRDVLLNYLKGFENLHLSGRNASFRYTHIHDQFMLAKKIVDSL